MAHRRRRLRNPWPEPSQLSDRMRASLQRRLKQARAELLQRRRDQKELGRTALKNGTVADAVRLMRAARRAFHFAWLKVRSLRHRLGLLPLLRLRRRQLTPARRAAMRRRKLEYLNEIATHVFLAVSYTGGHDVAVDDLIIGLLETFTAAESTGSGYAFAEERRDLDFRVRAVGGGVGHDDLQRALSAVLSNVTRPLTLQITAHAVFRVEGA